MEILLLVTRGNARMVGLPASNTYRALPRTEEQDSKEQGSHCTYIKALVRAKEKLSMVLVLYSKNTVWKALHKELNRGSRASSPNRPTLTRKQAGNFWIHYKWDFKTFFYYFLLIDLLSPLGCTPSFHLHMLHILSILMLFGEREVKRLYLEKTAWNRIDLSAHLSWRVFT